MFYPIIPTPYAPPCYNTRMGDYSSDAIIDITVDPDAKTLHITLWSNDNHNFDLIITHKPLNSSDPPVEYRLSLSEESVFNWASTLADLNTYIKLYGTVYGYKGPSPFPAPYTEAIRSSFDEVLLFARSALSLCKWDFLPFQFIHDLYRGWHHRNYPATMPLDDGTVFVDLQRIVYSNAASGRIGWAHIEYNFSMEPTITMRNPEPLIDAYPLELARWKNLRYGACSELAHQYEPSISDSWSHYLSDFWIRGGLTRMCKCNLNYLINPSDNSFFRETPYPPIA